MLHQKILSLVIATGITFSSASGVIANENSSASTASTMHINGNTEIPQKKPNGEMPMETTPEKLNEEITQENKQTELPFTDIENNVWYYNSISKAYEMGLISGISDKVFSPNTSVTAAQFLSMLYRTEKNNNEVQQNANWYDNAVLWAEKNSIIISENGWNFEAEKALTREQMMVILYRYMAYKGKDISSEYDISTFDDSEDISDYAKAAVKYLVSKEIILGDGNKLRPSDSITRAETAVILVKSLDKNTENKNIPQGNPPEKPNGNVPGGFGGSGTITQGSSANTISKNGSYTDLSYNSTTDDENALRIDNAEVTFNSITVDKSDGKSSNTEDGDFYGLNAALLATNGANITIKNSKINSSAQNGNGVFSYGKGTVVNISDSKITTTSDNSGGIQTTGGGTTNASNLTIVTNGNSAAAIRSDRGGGTVNVNGGNYTSNGYNSPTVYSTANITVSNSKLTAKNSEALVIEGKNSITLKNCNVSGNMSDTKGSSSDENVHNIMIYQSMSGDADVGTSVFNMSEGSLVNNNGDMFYVTNTHSIINLSNVSIDNKESDGYFMRVCGNSASHGWGKVGSNGAQVEFTADNQLFDGNIIVDTISNLDMKLSNNSVFNGTINITENKNGTSVSDNAIITIDSGSSWNLTGDCTVTNIENNGTINYNGYKITLADGTILGE